jgi:hypothetical protein
LAIGTSPGLRWYFQINKPDRRGKAREMLGWNYGWGCVKEVGFGWN